MAGPCSGLRVCYEICGHTGTSQRDRGQSGSTGWRCPHPMEPSDMGQSEVCSVHVLKGGDEGETAEGHKVHRKQPTASLGNADFVLMH